MGKFKLCFFAKVLGALGYGWIGSEFLRWSLRLLLPKCGFNAIGTRFCCDCGRFVLRRRLLLKQSTVVVWIIAYSSKLTCTKWFESAWRLIRILHFTHLNPSDSISMKSKPSSDSEEHVTQPFCNLEGFSGVLIAVGHFIESFLSEMNVM